MSHAGLNMLQSGLHKQHMKDPVRGAVPDGPGAAELAPPYLPMLMDPLVVGSTALRRWSAKACGR